MTITIWHNPRCSKSRQTLALLQEKGVNPPSGNISSSRPVRLRWKHLSTWWAASRAALIRDGEAEFKALGKKKAEMSKADIAKAIAAHPILLQRPIVVAGKKAAIGRPPEAVLPLLK